MTNYAKAQSGLLVPEPQKFIFAGRFKGQIVRGGYFDDKGLWHRGSEIIDEFDDHNLVVNEGLNDNLSAFFNAGTQRTAWYLGVFEGNYTPVAGVTAATIAAAATESTAYASSTRPTWTPAAPGSQAITNSASKASFVFNATKTIYGAFLVSSSTKGGTGGVLWSAARFSVAKSVVNLDELLLTYTFTAASA
jgi:hypothetical protein